MSMQAMYVYNRRRLKSITGAAVEKEDLQQPASGRHVPSEPGVRSADFAIIDDLLVILL